ncbi:phasin family protein [Hymenobacter coalescens]
MEDLFKKFIYAGVGFVSRTNDRVQDTINQLVQENKLSQTEGEKIMQALQKNTDTKRKEFETQINSIAKRVMKGMGVASSADVEELKRTVKGSGSSKASGAASASGSKKASTTAASNASGAAKTATKAAGAASTAAKKSAAGSKGATTAKKSSGTAASGSEGGSNA